MSTRRIGEILVAEGVLTEAAVNRALGFQRVSGERIKLGTILLNWDLLAEDGLLQALARHHRVRAAPWSVLSAAPVEVTRLIPAAMAIRLGAFPYAATNTWVHVAFLEPSDLAAQDEIAAVANKRVIPSVALEIRLLEAHHKFYGRHIPLEYRSIAQKLDRRSTKTKPPEWQKIVAFRAPDLIDVERRTESLEPSSPPGVRGRAADLGQTASHRRSTRAPATPISIARGLAEHEFVRDEIPTIEVPEMPMPAPPPASARSPAGTPRGAPSLADALSDTHPVAPSSAKASEDKPRAEKADRMSDTHPVKPGAQEPDDTLSKRMGKPFASLSSGERHAPANAPEIIEKIEFLPERDRPWPGRGAGSLKNVRPGETVDADDTLPRGASAHLPSRDFVDDMWRPGPESGDDSAASRMWVPSAAEIEASIGEARTREEIGHVALETLLIDISRVLLLSCGKTAITGWHGRGKDLTAESVAAIRIPITENDVFAGVRASGVPHFGPLEEVQWPRALAATLGEKAPDCAVFQIRILDGIAAFLYADRLGEPMHYEDFAVIARSAAATANALARFLLRRNNPAPVV